MIVHCFALVVCSPLTLKLMNEIWVVSLMYSVYSNSTHVTFMFKKTVPHEETTTNLKSYEK